MEIHRQELGEFEATRTSYHRDCASKYRRVEQLDLIGILRVLSNVRRAMHIRRPEGESTP